VPLVNDIVGSLPPRDVDLLEPDGITAADRAAVQDRGIDSNVSSVVLGCRAQNTGVLREIALCAENPMVSACANPTAGDRNAVRVGNLYELCRVFVARDACKRSLASRAVSLSSGSGWFR